MEEHIEVDNDGEDEEDEAQSVEFFSGILLKNLT